VLSFVEQAVGRWADRLPEPKGGAMSRIHDAIAAPVIDTATNPQPLLEASRIAKTYRAGVWPRRRNRVVLREASVTLWPGEVVGLVGENGSGKSTLMKILVGSLDRDAGAIQRPERIGYCPQEPILYERLTCDEHFEFFGYGYGMTSVETEERCAEIYQSLGFDAYAGTRVEELSGGTRAKLNLGLALLSDPELLLLDEPYGGFDWETYQRFWEIVHERRALGRAVLIISHFITDEDRFDRIIRLQEGRTVEG
jgi:ABC-2 type transport system ATP-binding protein